MKVYVHFRKLLRHVFACLLIVLILELKNKLPVYSKFEVSTVLNLQKQNGCQKMSPFKNLRIKISEKSLTQRFDVSMTSFSSEKIKCG